jgi:hypothetical protein
MKYDWFYDKKNGKFRNDWLEKLYNGQTDILSRGHDMLSIIEGKREYEYSEWSP